MADDEVRPLSEPPRSGHATPNRGVRRPPATIEGTAQDLDPDVPHPAEAEAIGDTPAPGDAEPEASDRRAEDATLHEPSMAAAAADLAAGVTPDEARPFSEDLAPAPAAPEPARRSRLPAVLAFLGVLLVLLLGAVLYTLYNPPNGDAVAGLRTEVDSLRQRLAALEARPAPAPDLKPLQDRVVALEAATGQLKSDLAAAGSKTEGQAASTTGAAQPAPPTPDLAPLQAKVADLDKGLGALGGTVAALPKIDLAPVEAKVSDLGDKVAAVQAAVAALPHVDLAPVDSRLADLDRRIKPIEAQLSAPKSTQQVTAARQEGSAAETRAAPLAVTAQAALAAIQAGKPFDVELKAMQALGVDEPKLAALRPVAAAGAPTDAALLSDFKDVEGRILGAGAPQPTGSVLDRMMAGAQNLVKVRPAGTLAGNDPDAIVSRIEGQLRAGDLPAALAEWNRLPADAKTASQAWADRLKARIDAETAARAVAADAIAAIASAK